MPIPKSETETLLHALREVHAGYVRQQIALLDALKQAYGCDVERIVEHVNGQLIRRRYLSDPAAGAISIDSLIALLWEPLRQKRYEFTIDRSRQGVQITCTACPLATLYRMEGGEHWGYRLYCAADAGLVEACNPLIGFRRTRTLMQGDACCDHFYYMKVNAGND